MFKTFILIHSPLVGPYTWKPVAEELRGRGHIVLVPSLLEVLDRSSGYVQAIKSEVSAQIDPKPLSEPVYLVMHSAAGAFASPLREAVNAEVAGYIFVDALLPKAGGSLSAGETSSVNRMRREMAREGFLPAWSEWFGEDVMKAAIPDEKRRSLFLRELRKIPMNFFEEPIPILSGWPEADCGYIRLSNFYKPFAEESQRRGWPVIEKEVNHLHMLVDPSDVVDMILELAEQFGKK